MDVADAYEEHEATIKPFFRVYVVSCTIFDNFRFLFNNRLASCIVWQVHKQEVGVDEEYDLGQVHHQLDEGLEELLAVHNSYLVRTEVILLLVRVLHGAEEE